jgi:putative inorganic carbon (hco3(-)) transporter
MNTETNMVSSVSIFLLVVLVSCSTLLLGDMSVKYVVAIVIGFIFFFVFIFIKNKSKFLFAALILSLPFATTGILIGTHPSTFHTGGAQVIPKINVVDLILMLFVCFKIIQGQSSLGTPQKMSKTIIISWTLFVIWSGLSIILSDHKMLGIISLYELLKISLLCFILAQHIKQEDQIEFAVKLLVIGLSVEGSLGIYQAYFGSPSWLPIMTLGETTTVEDVGNIVVRRVGGTIGWTTVFAQYLALLIPLSFFLLIVSNKKRSALIYGMSFILGFIALIYTFSRGGVLSLVIGLIVSSFCLFLRGSFKVRKRLLAASACFVFLFLISLPIITVRNLETDQGSAQNRIPMFQVAINIVKENPIFGTGLNSYSEIMHRYDPNHLISGFEFPVHNVYLFIAAEVGIPGLIFFVLFIANVVCKLISIIGKTSQTMSAISAGLLGGIFAVLLHGMVEQGIKGDIQLWYVFSAICGLSIAVMNIVDNKATNPSISRSQQ